MLFEAVVGGGEVEAGDGFDCGIGKYGIDEAAGHAGAVSGGGELGQPAAFLVGIDPGLEDFAEALREDDGHEGIPGAVDVPVAVVCVHEAGGDFAVEGAVVAHGPGGIGFVESAGEEQGAIEAGVEGALLVLGCAFDLNAEEVLVPAVGCSGAEGGCGGVGKFAVEVELGLVEGDEGGGDAGVDGCAGLEFDDAYLAAGVGAGVLDGKAFPGDGELEDVIGGEVIGDAAGVGGAGEEDAAVVGVGMDGGGFAEDIEGEAGGLGEVGRLEVGGEQRAAVGGNELDVGAVAEEEELQGVRGECGVLRPVGGGAGGRCWVSIAGEGKECGVAVVVKPGAELMGAAEALDAADGGVEHPGAGGAGLEGPVGHAKGKCGDGQGVAAGEGWGGVRSLEDVDGIDGAGEDGVLDSRGGDSGCGEWGFRSEGRAEGGEAGGLEELPAVGTVGAGV